MNLNKATQKHIAPKSLTFISNLRWVFLRDEGCQVAKMEHDCLLWNVNIQLPSIMGIMVKILSL